MFVLNARMKLVKEEKIVMNTGKYGPEITPHLDTFHSMYGQNCFPNECLSKVFNKMETNLITTLDFLIKLETKIMRWRKKF